MIRLRRAKRASNPLALFPGLSGRLDWPLPWSKALSRHLTRCEIECEHELGETITGGIGARLLSLSNRERTFYSPSPRPSALAPQAGGLAGVRDGCKFWLHPYGRPASVPVTVSLDVGYLRPEIGTTNCIVVPLLPSENAEISPP